MSEILFDIIIPHYGTSNINVLAAACVRSICEYSKHYRLIWIDNGGEHSALLQQELERASCLTLLRSSENVGFIKAVNAGLRESSAPRVVIMNNDTEAVPAWLERLNEPLVYNIGMSGPVTNARGSWQGRFRTGRGYMVLGQENMLAFFCVMLRRDVIEKVGFLDESFGVGFGDDDDYCMRVHAAGFRMALVLDLLIPHHHRTTFKAIYTEKEIADMQENAMKLLKSKQYA